jgi:hypothetical protein
MNGIIEMEKLGRIGAKACWKNLVFGGASNGVEETMNKLTVSPEYIMDKSNLNQG